MPRKGKTAAKPKLEKPAGPTESTGPAAATSKPALYPPPKFTCTAPAGTPTVPVRCMNCADTLGEAAVVVANVLRLQQEARAKRHGIHSTFAGYVLPSDTDADDVDIRELLDGLGFARQNCCRITLTHQQTHLGQPKLKEA